VLRFEIKGYLGLDRITIGLPGETDASVKGISGAILNTLMFFWQVKPGEPGEKTGYPHAQLHPLYQAFDALKEKCWYLIAIRGLYRVEFMTCFFL
jgi:hypothetical protein